MPMERSVQTRGQKFGIEEMWMRCDDTEFPDFWQVRKADSYWAAGQAAYLGPLSDLGLKAMGAAAFAILGTRVAVIVAPEDPTIPAKWLTFDQSEAKAVGVGQTGLFTKRPVSIEMEVGDTTLYFKYLSRVYRSSGSRKANQETDFLQLFK